MALTTIKGPAIFLAQFAGDKAPFNSLSSICKWAASLGFKGVQVPSWDGRMIDLEKAAKSKTYCDELKGIAKVADPIMKIVFEKIGSDTEDDMTKVLDRLAG